MRTLKCPEEPGGAADGIRRMGERHQRGGREREQDRIQPGQLGKDRGSPYAGGGRGALYL